MLNKDSKPKEKRHPPGRYLSNLDSSSSRGGDYCSRSGHNAPTEELSISSFERGHVRLNFSKYDFRVFNSAAGNPIEGPYSHLTGFPGLGDNIKVASLHTP